MFSVTVQIQNPTLDEEEVEQLTRRLYRKLQKGYVIKRIPSHEQHNQKGGGWLTGILKMSEVDQQDLSVIKATIEDQYPTYQVQEFHAQDGKSKMLQVTPRPSIQQQSSSQK